MQILDYHTGEVAPFDVKKLDNRYYLDIFIRYLLNLYFDFRYNDHQQKKSRMKKVNLFGKYIPIIQIAYDNPEQSSNRSDRIFLNKFISLSNEIREISHELEDQCNNIEDYYVGSRMLTKYRNYQRNTKI